MNTSADLPSSPSISEALPGVFISFEGVDGSGKSTQLAECAKTLKAWCQTHAPKRDVIVTKNPGGTPLGLEIRQILLRPNDEPMPEMAELMLYMADRAHHTKNLVIPALTAGHIVLCDRHMDSSLAYQGYGRGMSLETILKLNDWATGGVIPQLTLLYDGDPRQLDARLTQRQGAMRDRLEQEGLIFQEKVRDGFLVLAKQAPERIQVLDALENIESLHTQTMQRVLTQVSQTLALSAQP